MSGEVVALLVRLVVSLGVVLGLMLLAAKLLRHTKGLPAARPPGSDGEVVIVGRRALGRHASVAVVRAAGHQLVLGVTEQQVTLLQASAVRSAAEAVDLADLTGLHDLTDSSDHFTTAAGTRLPVHAALTQPPPARTNTLDRLRELTVRR